MIVRVEVEINTGDLDPYVVIKSLEPDNIDMPNGVVIHMEKKEGSIYIVFECSEDRILTCRSTADEVLMLINSTIKSLENSK
ncbi:MAG TPA: KEOPS complex subunit Pcc1 [Sulfolobales archaeon]|nr:KEOPS complex subunit Pcc1 [Sulfolobales archaeon]